MPEKRSLCSVTEKKRGREGRQEEGRGTRINRGKEGEREGEFMAGRLSLVCMNPPLHASLPPFLPLTSHRHVAASRSGYSRGKRRGGSGSKGRSGP
jgi:hypothetical protein